MQLSDDPTKPVKKLYDQQVALAHRNATCNAWWQRSISAIPRVFFFSVAIVDIYRSKLIPQVPHDLDDVIIQGVWRENWRGERFLLRQNNDWGIVMFATRRNISVGSLPADIHGCNIQNRTKAVRANVYCPW